MESRQRKILTLLECDMMAKPSMMEESGEDLEDLRRDKGRSSHSPRKSGQMAITSDQLIRIILSNNELTANPHQCNTNENQLPNNIPEKVVILYKLKF